MSRPPPDPVYMLRGSDYPITSLRFFELSNHEPILVSGDQNGLVQFWDLKTYRCKHSFTHDADKSVLYIEQLPGSGSFVTQSRGGSICSWTEEGGEFIKTSSFPTGSMGFCAGCITGFASNSPYMVIPSLVDQSEIEVIDLHNKQSIKHFKPTMPTHKLGMCMAVKSVSQTPDVNRILIGYESGCIVLWDFRADKVLDIYQAHKDSLMCFDYTENMNIGISGSADNKIASWKITNEGKIINHREIEITNPGLNCIKVRPDEKIFATAGWDSKIRIFGQKKLSSLAVLSSHTESSQCLDFSTDNLLACGSKDTRISLWDIYK